MAAKKQPKKTAEATQGEVYTVDVTFSNGTTERVEVNAPSESDAFRIIKKRAEDLGLTIKASKKA